jgi:hypothetical protein
MLSNRGEIIVSNEQIYIVKSGDFNPYTLATRLHTVPAFT